jgi:hypothetical protein
VEKISWTYSVRNEEVLHRVKEQRNIIHTVKRRKVNWIGHILRRNCLLKRIIEGQKEETVRRRRRHKQLISDLQETGNVNCPITGLDRPLGFQEAEATGISSQSAHEGGKVVSPTHRPSLPPGRIPGTHFC